MGEQVMEGPGHPSCSTTFKTFKEAQNFLQKDHKNEGCPLSLHLKVTFGE